MAIVWNSAMTVDTKVQNTREDMTHLIDTLSDKLAAYEVQLAFFSNQLSVVVQNQTNLITSTIKNAHRNREILPLTTFSLPVFDNTPIPLKPETEINTNSFKLQPKPETEANVDVQQKARSVDIKQQFKR
jgi:hypothetical protein